MPCFNRDNSIAKRLLTVNSYRRSLMSQTNHFVRGIAMSGIQESCASDELLMLKSNRRAQDRAP